MRKSDIVKKGGIGFFHNVKISALLGIAKNFSSKGTKVKTQEAHKSVLINQNIQFTRYFLEISAIRDKNIKNKTYKGIRYLKKLPVRGQRTHTNAQTAKKLNGNN